MSSIGKIATERNHRALMEIVMKPGNDVCADCKARAPRWASFNLGIFVCVSCASIHRKIGTHVTKVKSLSLDEWSKDQVEFMRQNGNIKANQLYNPDETRHPPPTNMIDSERDSELERFIRAKYEFKRFMKKSSHQTMVLPPPRTASVSIASRPKSTPAFSNDPTPMERRTSPPPPPPPEKTPQNMPSRMLSATGTYTTLSSPTPLSRHVSPPTRAVSQPLPFSSQSINTPSKGGVWDELISLQAPTQNSSLPLQFQSHSPLPPTPVAPLVMSPTGMPPLSQPFLTSNPLANMNMTASPFGTAPAMSNVSPLGTPSISLTAANAHTNPFAQQMAVTGTGLLTPASLPTSPASTLTIGANTFPFSAGPFGPPAIPAPQPLGLSPFGSHTIPSHPTGVFSPSPQPQLSPSMVPVSGTISAPHTPSPFSTPFVAGSTLPSQQQPYATSAQGAFGTTPFLQQQMQYQRQSPVQLQPQQQQMFGQSGQFGGWQGQGF